MAGAGGKISQPPTVGRERGAHAEFRDIIRTRSQGGPVKRGFLQALFLRLGQVFQLRVFREFFLEAAQVGADERVQHGPGVVAGAEQFQHLPGLFPAVLLRQETDGLPAGLVRQRGLVGLEVAELVKPAERDKPPGKGGVPHVHFLHGVIALAGLVLGDALHHPERINEGFQDAGGFPEAVYQDAELDFVRELVLYNVLQPAPGTVRPDHETVLVRLGQAADAVRNVGHVGLLHVVYGGVEKERDPLGKGGVEVGGLALIGGLQHAGGVGQPGRGALVIMHVEMLRRVDLPGEVFYDHLVLFERGSRARGKQERGQRQAREKAGRF